MTPEEFEEYKKKVLPMVNILRPKLGTCFLSFHVVYDLSVHNRCFNVDN